jgi:hypothetical protein
MLRPDAITSIDKLRLVSNIILVGFILAIFFHGTLTLLNFDYPFNTFLFQPWDRFKDFLILHDISKDLNPYVHNTNYFPLAYLLYFPFTLLANQNIGLVIFIGIFCCFMCWNANYYLRTALSSDYIQNVVVVCFLSYPILFTLDRANLDALVYIFVALFFISFTKKNYILAAFFLAIATGMKAFPGIFIILFIKQKQYKAAFYCITFTFILSLVALSSFKTGIFGSVAQFQHLSHNLIQKYVIQDGNLTSSISLFSLIKVILKYFYLIKTGSLDETTYRNAIAMILPYYVWLSVAIFAMMSCYILFIETSLWKQSMLLAIMLTLLPSISGDYRLIFLYLPLLLFISNPRHERLDFVYTVLFGLLFIPKNFFIMPYTLFYAFECFPGGPCGTIPIGGYSVMSLLNIAILFTFTGLIIYTGIKQHVHIAFQLTPLAGAANMEEERH